MTSDSILLFGELSHRVSGTTAAIVRRVPHFGGGVRLGSKMTFRRTAKGSGMGLQKWTGRDSGLGRFEFRFRLGNEPFLAAFGNVVRESLNVSRRVHPRGNFQLRQMDSGLYRWSEWI